MAVTKLATKARKQPSVKDRVSEAEWKMRTDLAAAYQLAVIYGMTDMILTHFSARYSRDPSELERQARERFPATTCVRDGQEIDVPYAGTAAGQA